MVKLYRGAPLPDRGLGRERQGSINLERIDVPIESARFGSSDGGPLLEEPTDGENAPHADRQQGQRVRLGYSTTR